MTLHPALVIVLVMFTTQSWVTSVAVHTKAMEEAQALMRIDRELGLKKSSVRATVIWDYIFWPNVNVGVTTISTAILIMYMIWG